jgi:hypothetical protein
MRSPYQRKYTQRENLQIISYDPEGFKEGLFSVPAEIDGVDKVKLPDGVIMSQSAGFIVGHMLGIDLALKNSQVGDREVEDV